MKLFVPVFETLADALAFIDEMLLESRGGRWEKKFFSIQKRCTKLTLEERAIVVDALVFGFFKTGA